MNCLSYDVRCLAWREGKRHLLTFPELNAGVEIAYRALAVCRLGTRLAVSTEESKLLIYQLPNLAIEEVIPCRLPILSISPTAGGVLLMTDRHGNILSLDGDLQMAEHGRCSYDLLEDYPSTIYPAGEGAFYVSSRRCVTLVLGGESKRDILQVDGEGGHWSVLTYSRARGFLLSVGGEAFRPLRQQVVGHQYESEFSNFKAAWSARGTVAYTDTPYSVTLENSDGSTRHPIESEVLKIQYFRALDGFLVLCRPGVLHFINAEDAEPFSLQLARSDAGHYLMEACGTHVCVVAHDVLCQPAFGNAYLETVFSPHRLYRSRGATKAEVTDIQHIENRQPRILSLAYHQASNSLYICREFTLERWQLDDPKRHKHTRVAVPSDRDLALPFCADTNGAFYVSRSNQLKFQSMTSTKKTAELASFRMITFISPAVNGHGYMVEDNHALYGFAIEEE